MERDNQVMCSNCFNTRHESLVRCVECGSVDIASANVKAEVLRVRAINAEMLDALGKASIELDYFANAGDKGAIRVANIVRAVIAKATEREVL